MKRPSGDMKKALILVSLRFLLRSRNPALFSEASRLSSPSSPYARFLPDYLPISPAHAGSIRIFCVLVGLLSRAEMDEAAERQRSGEERRESHWRKIEEVNYASTAAEN